MKTIKLLSIAVLSMVIFSIQGYSQDNKPLRLVAESYAISIGDSTDDMLANTDIFDIETVIEMTEDQIIIRLREDNSVITFYKVLQRGSPKNGIIRLILQDRKGKALKFELNGNLKVIFFIYEDYENEYIKAENLIYQFLNITYENRDN